MFGTMCNQNFNIQRTIVPFGSYSWRSRIFGSKHVLLNLIYWNIVDYSFTHMLVQCLLILMFSLKKCEYIAKPINRLFFNVLILKIIFCSKLNILFRIVEKKKNYKYEGDRVSEQEIV